MDRVIFTEEQIKNILDWYSRGMPRYQIARKIGCHDTVIYRFLIKRGIKLKPARGMHKKVLRLWEESDRVIRVS